MPTINKGKKVSNYNNNKKLAQKLVYSTTRWTKLRALKIINNPLCEECLLVDSIKPTEEVHHITPFMNGLTVDEIKWLGFDYNNLQSLCCDCHTKKHKR